MRQKNFYLKNDNYTQIVEEQDEDSFLKYINFMIKLSGVRENILDVGCGTGTALELLKKKKKNNLYGIDISKTSIEKCQKKGINCLKYDGEVFPFPENYFHLVGSHNVLEHVEKPEKFLNEKYRVLKKGGYLIVVCPNFFSITNNFHPHTIGYKQKAKNLLRIFTKIFSNKYKFEKMKTVIREDFHSDDDACNVTNPQDILKWARVHKLKLIYWSSQSVYKKGIINFLDFSFLRIFFGSLFMVFKKR